MEHPALGTSPREAEKAEKNAMPTSIQVRRPGGGELT
jgi:hypothetical protein